MKPGDLSPRSAASRYLDNRRPEVSDGTYSSYRYRLKLFVEWCENEGIENIGDLNGWTLDEYRAYRAAEGLQPSTLHNEMDTLRIFAGYLDRIEATDDLQESVDVPMVPDKDRSRDKMLEPERALDLLKSYRGPGPLHATRFHVLLELAWHTGARMGGIIALDLRDVDLEENYLWFRHRPETDTPLKKQRDGERPVAISEEVTTVIQDYIDDNRPDGHDEYGREPLLVTSRGTRPAGGTLRSWMYEATQPCHFRECPHGHERSTCDYREHGRWSGCPSSRAPHHVRTGSLTWQRNRGVPKDVLKERANAAESTIEEYYDKATSRDRMETRRRPYVDKLGLDHDAEDDQ